MADEEKFFEVGDRVNVLEAKWHIKEFPCPAVISQVLTPGFSYRVNVEGFEWELGPFLAHQLEERGKSCKVNRKRVRSVGRQKRGFFQSDS